MNTINLNGTYRLSAFDNYRIPENISLPDNLQMTIPGDVHSVLIRNDLIPDPYCRKNEIDVQWVGQTSWQLEKEFSVGEAFLKGRQFIELEEADTFIRIYINEQEAGLTENFFRKWRFDVTGLLKKGKNTLRLVLECSEEHAAMKAMELKYPVPCSIYDIFSPHRNLVRKTQCNAGWDWGICLMVTGIYKSIRLVQTGSGFLDYVQTTTEPVEGSSDWNVHIKAIYNSIKTGKTDFSFAVSHDGNELVTAYVKADLHEGENIVETDITVKNPEIWWPAGTSPADEAAIIEDGTPLFKENTIYTLSAKAAGSVIEQNLCFRTLETVTDNDEYGKPLYFRVNGKPVFAKGFNWIPCDALPERQTPEQYEYLLRSLVEANGNAIRVWGGGMYEKDVFYDLCDRLGILIWQDCMFACSMYPADKDFLDNVRLEIRHQVRRLSHHPSIALWCGNNENLGAIGWYEESRNNKALYLVNYDRLNEGTVGDEVRKNDPSRRWWNSSPCSGDDDFADNWHSDGRGDMHYWSVWHEKKSFDAYLSIRPRFVSEFGYQSLPSLSEVETFAEKKDFNITSPVFEFHQRSPGGNSIIFENFARYFRVPSTFKDTLYLSQVQQALAIKTAVDYWRSLKPVCMGSLIWQLNDVWPISSWSSIEYSGKWKLLHYAAKDFFAPVGISLFLKDETIECSIINDTSTPVSPRLKLSYLDFDGNVLKEWDNQVLMVFENSSLCVHTEALKDIEHAPDSFFVHAELTCGKSMVESTLFVTQPKKCELQEPAISSKITENKDGSLAIELTAEKPAFYVSLDAGNLPGVFSRNFLTILPGKPVQLTFSQNRKGRRITASSLRNKLTITSLRDIY